MWRRNLYATWFAQIFSLAGFGFVLPFIPYYIQELGVTEPDQIRLWAGILTAAPALGMAIAAPLWGLAADRWGKRIMMLRAMASGAVILTLMAFARSVQMVLFLRVTQGLFTGTITASAALVASGTPRHQLNFALGFLSSSTFIGISIGPLLGGLTAEWFGYRTSFMIGGSTLIVGFFIVLLLITEHTAPLDPDEQVHATLEQSLYRRLLSVIPSASVGFFALIVLLRFARSLPAPFIALFIQDTRGTIEGSAAITGALSASRGAVSAVAGLTVTRLGDRYSRTRVITLLLCLGTASTLPLYWVGTVAWFFVFMVLSALALGGVEPMVQAALSSRTPASRRGLLFGVLTTIGSAGWFVSPMIGSVVSINFGIPAVFLTLAVFLFLTTGVALVTHRRQHG